MMVVPQVDLKNFYLSESAMSALRTQVPEDSFWESKVGLGLNAAFKDPPVFLLLGKADEPSDVANTLAGIDQKYPGTAKVRRRKANEAGRGLMIRVFFVANGGVWSTCG